MSLKHYNELNDMHMDALCEIGNIGSGNAATSISQMLGRPVDISVPKVEILECEQVMAQLGGPEQLLVGLMLFLSGEVTGMMMFLLNKDFAHTILNTLLGSEFTENGNIDEMDQSAIREVGNIMAASYINAIAAMTGLEINISPPDLCVDMAGSILSVPAIYYANIDDKIISISDEFNHDDTRMSSHILMIPEVDSLEKIIASLGLDI